MQMPDSSRGYFRDTRLRCADRVLFRAPKASKCCDPFPPIQFRSGLDRLGAASGRCILTGLRAGRNGRRRLDVDLDRMLGTGLEIVAHGLTVGPHVITVTVPDGLGGVATASMLLRVVRQ